MDAPLALYRRYRPETFAEVIGQDHVTEPLRAALANNRVNHAYLFSGPRGCGKTTSARILARALNCEQAPVADPCGECDSCRDLARGGPGSIDVIEIDAASHGGVDDARDLREKAFFAPVRSRYKVYIIDEAHMVTTQGFNALLKLVEEPPPHLRFIFATTEPEKVLPTIRSRTHHYPFRLIPPRLLSTYLSELCEMEGVAIEQAALPLVVRAGGGSARDTLSVLDQLLGGAGPEGVTHELATGLLGYTPDSLLDEITDAFAAGDGADVFHVIDKVVETGQDPRRFTEDLLRRLRDLVIVAAIPDAPASGLIDVSEDAGERLVAQAARFGVHDLSRAADLVAAGLTEMRGATAPRMLLELICARVLLPGADDSTDGLVARLDRLERRLTITPTSHPIPAQPRPAAATPSAHAPPPPHPLPRRPGPRPRRDAPSRRSRSRCPAEPSAAAAAAAPSAGERPSAPAGADEAAGGSVDGPGRPPRDERGRLRPPPSPGAPEGRPHEPAPAAPPRCRRQLPPRRTRRFRQQPQPGRRTPPLARHRRRHEAEAAGDVDPPHPARPGRGRRREDAHPRLRQRRRPGVLRQRRQPRDRAAGGDRRGRRRLAGRGDRRPGARADVPPPPAAAPADPGPESHGAPPAAEAPDAPPAPPAPTATASAEVVSAAREAIAPIRTPGSAAESAPRVDLDADAHPDDPDIESSGLAGAELLQRELGAQIIHEIKHD